MVFLYIRRDPRRDVDTVYLVREARVRQYMHMSYRDSVIALLMSLFEGAQQSVQQCFARDMSFSLSLRGMMFPDIAGFNFSRL